MKLSERLKDPKYELGVRQYQAVLDFVTDVEDAMNAQGVNQATLAKRLGKSAAWISKIFRQRPNLTFFTAVELAAALGLEVRIKAEPRSVAISQTIENAGAGVIVPLADWRANARCEWSSSVPTDLAPANEDSVLSGLSS